MCTIVLHSSTVKLPNPETNTPPPDAFCALFLEITLLPSTSSDALPRTHMPPPGAFRAVLPTTVLLPVMRTVDLSCSLMPAPHDALTVLLSIMLPASSVTCALSKAARPVPFALTITLFTKCTSLSPPTHKMCRIPGTRSARTPWTVLLTRLARVLPVKVSRQLLLAAVTHVTPLNAPLNLPSVASSATRGTCWDPPLQAMLALAMPPCSLPTMCSWHTAGSWCAVLRNTGAAAPICCCSAAAANRKMTSWCVVLRAVEEVQNMHECVTCTPHAESQACQHAATAAASFSTSTHPAGCCLDTRPCFQPQTYTIHTETVVSRC